MWPVDRDQYEMMEVDSDCTLEEYGKKHQLDFESHSFYLESSSCITENSDMIIENKVVIHSLSRDQSKLLMCVMNRPLGCYLEDPMFKFWSHMVTLM